MPMFFSFVRKEFYHIFRDRRTLLILLVMPVVMILLFGYAVTTELKSTRLVVQDFSQDELTRQITDRFAVNPYFSLVVPTASWEEVDGLFRQGKADMVLVFGDRFAERLRSEGTAKVQLLVDGCEPNQAAMRTAYAQQILRQVEMEWGKDHQLQPDVKILPVTRMLYNPQQRSEYNFVPGIMGVVMMLICAMMSSISIVREKELGSMEVLLTSPVRPIYIILAKLVPFFVISLGIVLVMLLLTVFLMHIPIAGNVLLFVAVSLIYIWICLSIGLLISTLANTQLVALLFSLLLIVPTVYISGMVFPIESMPLPMQNASALFPARWYIDAARKILIQGVEVQYVVKNIGVMCLMAVVLDGVALKLFKTRLE